MQKGSVGMLALLVAAALTLPIQAGAADQKDAKQVSAKPKTEAPSAVVAADCKLNLKSNERAVSAGNKRKQIVEQAMASGKIHSRKVTHNPEVAKRHGKQHGKRHGKHEDKKS